MVGVPVRSVMESPRRLNDGDTSEQFLQPGRSNRGKYKFTISHNPEPESRFCVPTWVHRQLFRAK